MIRTSVAGLDPDFVAAPSRGPQQGPRVPKAIWLLYTCAIFCFARCHVAQTFRYVSLTRYLAGTERLPYQRRLLVMAIIRGGRAFRPYRALEAHMSGHIVAPGLFSYFLVDLLSLGVAAWFCQKLYKRASRTGATTPFLLAIFLFTMAWTYLIAPEGSIFYPYDLASVAFFTAGLYFVYTRRFLPLLPIMLLGTANRETTIFLVPLLLLDAAVEPSGTFRSIPWKRLPWAKAVALTAAWLLVRFALGRLYTHNDLADDYLRYRENLPRLLPGKWPELLGACGFLLPILFVYRRQISDARIRAYFLILPFWAVVMIVYGVISEVRVFGELCSLVSVAAALLLDSYMGKVRTPISELPSLSSTSLSR